MTPVPIETNSNSGGEEPNANGASSGSGFTETSSSIQDASSSQKDASSDLVPAPIPQNGIPGGEPDDKMSNADPFPAVDDSREDDGTPSADTAITIHRLRRQLS